MAAVIGSPYITLKPDLPLLLKNGYCRGDNPNQDDLLWLLHGPSSGAAEARRASFGHRQQGVLLVLFSLERDALKAWRHVDHQVLSIV